MEMKRMLSLSAGMLLAGISLGAADVTISKPYFRWLFNGFGFQNSEANFLSLMPDDFRDQRVLKMFAELSPTFGRVYTGFADESKEQLDRFADYYDLTFRKAGTTLYAVPCAMPPFADTIDAEEYAEKVAKNLEYLIKVRKCRKIRYYCLTNELMCGDNWAWFVNGDKSELFKKFYAALFHAFRRHGLDIRLLASDEAATTKPEKVFPFLDWIKANMDDYVGAYCTHWYVYGRKTSDLGLWNEYNAYFSNLVQRALSCKAKRYILGEFGFHPAWGKRGVMVDDVSYHLRQPETKEESVLAKCEVGLAAMNQGAAACVDWSFVDYPDPFVIEDGDSPEEHARYEAGKCGYRIDTKYNKCGVFRWSTTDRDYSSYAELYAMGWIVKLFRKNATVLPCAFADPMLRGGAVINPDRSVSIALINRGPAKTATVDCSSWKTRVDGPPALHQPLRRYVYEAARVPYSPFNDLQPMSGTVTAKDGAFSVALPAKSITFLTTDYEDRTPPPVGGLRERDGVLSWTATDDPAHRYYRVYADGRQVASTAATSAKVPSAKAYDVRSVDRWNNEGAPAVRKFVDVSRACPRYFADATGKTWIPVGINLCYAHPADATAVDVPEAEFLASYERWMRAFAANGGNFIRIFLCRPTVDVLTDKPGVWNERAVENLWKLVHLAETLGIKIKFTMEVFRMIIPDAEATTDYKKKLNKSFYLPYAKSLREFFHSPECERLFLDKARFYASRGFGDSPAVICWEPWNEINSTGAIADYAPWSARVQGAFRKLFPRQMVTQNLGSFSSPDAVHIYDQLGEAEPNDFMQVHRYLDPGAELDVCRGPMDVLCADAVRELLARRDDKPALLAEAGSVEKHHSGPSHLMALDKEGTMLHDALFAPFFAGGAGTGCNWHWAIYVENNNLWYHFARFRKAVEGLDPAAEAFRPFRTETHAMRIWGLKGRKTTVLWLRDKASDWRSELEKGVPARKLEGNKLPFATTAPARWYLPWEDRTVETPAGPLVAPAFRRSAVVRFPTNPEKRDKAGK